MSSWLHKCQPTMSSGDQQKIPEVVATLGDIQGWSYCKRPCQGVSVLYRRFKQVFKASFSLWSFSLLVDLIYYVLKMQSHHSWVRKERSPPRRENGVYKAEENQSGARTLPRKENVLPRTVLSIKLMNMLQIHVVLMFAKLVKVVIKAKKFLDASGMVDWAMGWKSGDLEAMPGLAAN